MTLKSFCFPSLIIFLSSLSHNAWNSLGGIPSVVYFYIYTYLCNILNQDHTDFCALKLQNDHCKYCFATHFT